MADLEEAAETALARAVDLRDLLARARSTFAAVERQAADLATRLDADWAALDERARALIDRCAEEHDSLARDGEEARGTLAALTEAIDGARPAGEASLEATRASLAGLGARWTRAGPEVLSMADQVEEAARETVGRAADVAEALADALADARDLVERTLVQDVEAMQEAIDDSAESCCRSIAEVQSQVEERCADWRDALAVVLDLVEQAFDDARRHLADVTEYSLAECRRKHQEFWEGDVLELLQHLEGVLRELADTVDERVSYVTAGDGALREANSAVDDRLVNLLAALERAKERLATYDFVEL